MRKFLSEKYRHGKHPICLGIDPDFNQLHPFLQSELTRQGPAVFLFEWYANLIDSVKVCSIKLQSAFFEVFCDAGQIALKRIVEDAKKRGLYVILDAKRGDISTTMSAYGQAAYESIGVDAMTILPWMGLDSLKALEPWLKQGRGVYTVWLSSNTTGRQIQESEVLSGQTKGQTLAAKVFDVWEQWILENNLEHQCGYVLGATSVPDWATKVLSKRSHALLMPGIGAQGASFNSALRTLHSKHPATIFPLSRGITKINSDVSIDSWDQYQGMVATKFNDFHLQWQACGIQE
jgi:orotidine-5'-phosphate decarboxylase